MANASGNTSHLVIYMGYELYDDEWDNAYSKIWIMDPFNGEYDTLRHDELISGYGNVYQ